METTYNGFKQDSGVGNKTPPPAYTNFAGPSSLPSGSQVQSGAGFDPYNPYSPYNNVVYNPWAAVPTATHPNPALNSGPTPTSALQIPYAYYDPRSAHSLAEADARAKARFWNTLIFVLSMWVLCGFVLSELELDYHVWLKAISEGWDRFWGGLGRF
jgi:hypothetical protein